MIIVGFFVGAYYSSPRKDRVQKVAPENGRGTDYEAKSQDGINVYCDPLGNEPPQKFIKTGYALNMIRKGLLGRLTHYALWTGRYGTAYTFTIGEKSENLSLKEALIKCLGEAEFYRDIKEEQIKKIEEDTNKYKLGEDVVKTTLEKTMRNIFGKNDREIDEYDLLPEATKIKIRDAEVGVIIEFPGVPLTPAGLPSVSSDDVHRDNDQKVVNALVNGIKKLGSGGPSQTFMMLLPMLTFAGGIILAYLLHIGGTTVVETTPPSS